MTHEPLVHVSSRLPLADYIRLVDWARAHDLVHRRDKRPNLSGALREVVALGLAAEADRAREEETGNARE